MIETIWQSDDGLRSVERSDKGVFFVWRVPMGDVADSLKVPTDFHLTKREKEIFDLIIEGFSDKQIADKTGISIRTVKFHNHAIYRKAQVPGRLDLIRDRHRAMKETTA